MVNPIQRQKYLKKLSEFQTVENPQNWRFREELSRQLMLCLPLFGLCSDISFIGKIALNLFHDKVAAVRESSITLVSKQTTNDKIFDKSM